MQSIPKLHKFIDAPPLCTQVLLSKDPEVRGQCYSHPFLTDLAYLNSPEVMAVQAALDQTQQSQVPRLPLLPPPIPAATAGIQLEAGQAVLGPQEYELVLQEPGYLSCHRAMVDDLLASRTRQKMPEQDKTGTDFTLHCLQRFFSPPCAPVYCMAE